MKEKLLMAMHSLKNANIPCLGFIAVTIHIVMNGAGIGDAIALSAICALYGYRSYLDKKEGELIRVISQELNAVKTEVSSLKIKTMQAPTASKEAPKRFF